jgi:hypothetical protein
MKEGPEGVELMQNWMKVRALLYSSIMGLPVREWALRFDYGRPAVGAHR